MPKATEQSPQIDLFSENRQRLEQISIDEITFPPELIKQAEVLRKISQTWNPVEFVTASSDSIEREKSKLFEHYLKHHRQGTEYHPTFDYPRVEEFDQDINATEKEIKKILAAVRRFQPSNTSDRLAKVVLYYKVRDDLATVLLIKGIKTKNDEIIKHAFNIKYAPVDDALLETARSRYGELTEKPPPQTDTETDIDTGTAILTAQQQQLLREHKVDAEGIKKAFEWVLKGYGILRDSENPRGFRVVISDEATAIDVRDKSTEPMTIYIPRSRVVSGDKLLSLMYHEIEGHARQSMNGMKYMVGGGPLRVDEETLYEGLAKRLDERFASLYMGIPTEMPAPFYTLAAKSAEEGKSFYRIFTEQVLYQLHVLLKLAPEEDIDFDSQEVQDELDKAMSKAWKTTYRIMRGHINTANPDSYAFRKDVGYLRGWLLDNELGGLGLEHYNEIGIVQTEALPLLGRVAFNYSDLEYPFRDLTLLYCKDVLLPKLDQAA